MIMTRAAARSMKPVFAPFSTMGISFARRRLQPERFDPEGLIHASLTVAYREHRPGIFQIRLADEDLAWAGRDELLERRLDRLGVAVAALDPVRPEQPAYDLRLRLIGDHGDDDDVLAVHQPTPASRNARLSRAISRAITRRWTSCVPS